MTNTPFLQQITGTAGRQGNARPHMLSGHHQSSNQPVGKLQTDENHNDSLYRVIVVRRGLPHIFLALITDLDELR